MDPRDADDEEPNAAERRAARAHVRRSRAFDDVGVPRRRGKHLLGMPAGMLAKIVLTAGLLVMLVAIRRPCANNVSNFVIDLDRPASGSGAMPRPDNVAPATGSAAQTAPAGSAGDYELITPDMTDAERAAAIERARARARAGSGVTAP